MEGIFQALAYALWTLVKFIGLTLLSILSLATSILINVLAIASLQSWLPVPGFLFSAFGSPFLFSLSHFLGIGGF
jgi:hypothetical protein